MTRRLAVTAAAAALCCATAGAAGTATPAASGVLPAHLKNRRLTGGAAATLGEDGIIGLQLQQREAETARLAKVRGEADAKQAERETRALLADEAASSPIARALSLFKGSKQREVMCSPEHCLCRKQVSISAQDSSLTRAQLEERAQQAGLAPEHVPVPGSDTVVAFWACCPVDEQAMTDRLDLRQPHGGWLPSKHPRATRLHEILQRGKRMVRALEGEDGSPSAALATSEQSRRVLALAKRNMTPVLAYADAKQERFRRRQPRKLKSVNLNDSLAQQSTRRLKADAQKSELALAAFAADTGRAASKPGQASSAFELGASDSDETRADSARAQISAHKNAIGRTLPADARRKLDSAVNVLLHEGRRVRELQGSLDRLTDEAEQSDHDGRRRRGLAESDVAGDESDAPREGGSCGENGVWVKPAAKAGSSPSSSSASAALAEVASEKSLDVDVAALAKELAKTTADLKDILSGSGGEDSSSKPEETEEENAPAEAADQPDTSDADEYAPAGKPELYDMSSMGSFVVVVDNEAFDVKEKRQGGWHNFQCGTTAHANYWDTLWHYVPRVMPPERKARILREQGLVDGEA